MSLFWDWLATIFVFKDNVNYCYGDNYADDASNCKNRLLQIINDFRIWALGLPRILRGIRGAT